ncbi:MAG: hypothetical protein QOK42_2086 [Frankiaceae bacterium]|jgi:hypothetical protein|nr:hypothetical protein [Frankiaceae bacterium]
MRAPQPPVLDGPNASAIAVRCISALIGVVVLVGLTAAAQPAPRNEVAATSVGALSLTQVADGRGLVPQVHAATTAPKPHLTAPPHTAKPKAKRPQAATKRDRVLPTGTGMWLHEWDKSNQGNAAVIVRRAKSAGVSTLFVRGWSRTGGWEAPHVLRQLLPATKHSDVKVVVWEFVYLQHPVAEARRLAASAKIRVPGAPRVIAVAPDIETAAEGSRTSYNRVLVYMRALRAALPKDVAILGTVPWPSEVRVGKFPYQPVALYSDALLPMTYWYNRSPVAVTQSSVRWLRRYHKPIMPVGQGYDGRLDAPWLPKANVPKQVASFLVTAKRAKVPAVSLWSWQTAPLSVWGKLSKARHDFGPRAAAKPRAGLVVPAPVRTP